MDHLIVPVQWKAATSPAAAGELDGYASVFGNVDRDGDVVLPGAFKKTLADWSRSRQPLPLLADHDLSTAGVIGSVSHAEEDPVGLHIRASFSSTQKAQDIRTNMIEGHLKGMSFTYQTVKHFMGQVGGKSARFLQELRLFEATVSPFPINELAVASAKAAISTADRNSLPDSDFGYIEPGGTKDSEGKTEPRSLRHFPIHDAAHVRAALARIGQGAEFAAQARPKVEAAARKLGIDMMASASIDFAQFADSMRAALAIPVERASKAAADLLVAAYHPAAGLPDEQPTADAAAPGEGTAVKGNYSDQFLIHPPEPRDGALDPLAPLETARVNAGLDRVEAEINRKLGRTRT